LLTVVLFRRFYIYGFRSNHSCEPVTACDKCCNYL